MAYDFVGMRKSMERAVVNLRRARLSDRRLNHVCVYVLYNYKDNPEDLFERARDITKYGACGGTVAGSEFVAVPVLQRTCVTGAKVCVRGALHHDASFISWA